ncbi:hypothetical protein Pcinc_005055 [Petrolisthes cinctipes]|uniref:Uncharacterized protein n=1 Tax=Petrolisthes cinctipes TaxID=88211 RepID=A0AAE1GK77_PETCI|nr:hypothetical protein Pcinc_005055 [Petrolisthes cinctipes]
MDVLGVFPHTHTHTHKHQGGHMRNATFPGIKISTVMKLSLSLHSPPVHTPFTLPPSTLELWSCTRD